MNDVDVAPGVKDAGTDSADRIGLGGFSFAPEQVCKFSLVT